MSLEDLDDIERKHGTDSHRCLEQMLLGWLKRTRLQPTLKLLCSVLRGEMVQEEALADDIGRMWIFKVRQLEA